MVHRDPTGCLTAFYFSPFEVRDDSNPSGDGLPHLSRIKLGGAATVSLAIQGRFDPIPTPLEASCSLAWQVVLMRIVCIRSARSTLSGRVCFGPPHGYPGVTSPTIAPERFTVEPQHIFVEVLGQVEAERLGYDLLFV